MNTFKIEKDIKELNKSNKIVNSTAVVSTAVNNGLINGIDDNNFAPNASITREQAVAIIYRASKKVSLELPKTVDEAIFDDKCSDYATEAILALQRANIIAGVGENLFKPFDNLTRAQAAKIICGVYEML